MKSYSQAAKLVSGFGFLILSACATKPYPYFDSSINDHNRAPASLEIPADVTVAVEKVPDVAKQSETDFLFFKSDVETTEGRSDSAIELLKAAQQLDPKSATLMQKLSLEYYKTGKLSEATYWIAKSLEVEPNRKDNLLLYGSMLMGKKDFDLAEATYTKILKLYPTDPESYLYLGALYSEKNDFKKSNGFFTKVISIGTYEPKHLPYYYRARGIVDSKKTAQFAQAKKDLKKCFELRPDFLEAIQVYSNIIEKTEGKKAVYAFYIDYQKKYGPVARVAEVLSQYYIEKEQYDKAYDQLEILEATSDDVIQVKLKMALILIDQKNFKKAAVKLEELNIAVPESDKVKFYLSAVYEELKQPEKAITNYLLIQPASPHYGDSRVRAAFLQKNSGNVDLALKTMKQAYEAKKDNLQIFLMYAQLNEDLKKYYDAVEILKKADTAFPKNSQINYFLGTLYDRQEKKDLMLKHMRFSVAYDDKNYQAMNYVAYSLAESGANLDEAEQMALNAYSLQKDDAFIIDTLGWVYFKKGQFEKALPYIEKAHDLSPDVAVIAEHLGDVYAKLKKQEKAKSAYMKAQDKESDTDRLKTLKNKISALESSNQVRQPASENIFP